MRTPLNTNLLRLRSEAMVALSNFFAEEQFQQTHPPIITSSDCEGAGETFNVNSGTRDDPFYQKPMYLTVSSQLHLEALAQALGNVWTLSPTFRAERSDTSRHLSEFYMLEAELSFVEDMDDILDFVQKMLKVLAQRLSSGKPYKELMAARQSSQDSLEKRTLEELDDFEEVQRRWRGILDPQKWPRITYTDAIEMLQSHSAEFESPAVWGDGLRSEHERFLAKKLGFDENLNAYRPVFVTRYPRDIKAFYMLQTDQGAGGRRLVDCFDLLVPDLGELAGGSMREHRLSHLLQNMDDLGFDKHSKDSMRWYLDLRKWGCPPHGGFGVGFDRLLSYLTGVKSVRDIVPFPRVFGREDF
jgi:asparaginyl-tRNA synthetase